MSPDNSNGELDGISDTSFHLQRCRDAYASRALFVTDDGHLGAAAESVAVGDEIIALFGCFVPEVLRPFNTKPGRYLVVSDCYLESISSPIWE